MMPTTRSLNATNWGVVSDRLKMETYNRCAPTTNCIRNIRHLNVSNFWKILGMIQR